MKLTALLVIFSIITSCQNFSSINGRKYKIKKECLEYTTRIEPRMVGKVLVMMPVYYCKTYGPIDTIWK